MLQLKSIVKDYVMGDNTVHALRGVSMNFRKNEFVSILGPSGCGKTTMLNIIGGLDRYSNGDLIISGKSTKQYKDRDWDIYRNHHVGFVFQSYNLIPHQTVLANVELSLTIAGLNKAERVEKAKAALDKVGLSDQYNKKPNQLSGGQMQRVAIARALVNDPDILLADEPTGALDTVTSKQIMEIVKEVAKDRLVIMVTHNSELAEEYSTRIIRLRDGELLSDSNPYNPKGKEGSKEGTLEKKSKKGKSKMSFFTAFKLSLQNLFSKKRRTFMTAIAGSIGIIGVSLVLSFSYGIQNYIDTMQNDMLSGNPIEIMRSTMDINAMMDSMSTEEQIEFMKESGWININEMMARLAKQADSLSSMFVKNEITEELTAYIKGIPQEYLAALHLDYGLNVSNSIYTNFRLDSQDDGKGTSLTGIKSIYSSVLGETEYSDYSSLIDQLSSSFAQAPDADEYILSQYNLLNHGSFESKIAKDYNEVMIVLGKDRQLNDLLLAQLGYYTQEEFINMIYKTTEDKKYDDTIYENSILDYNETTGQFKVKYDDVIGRTFTWYPNDSIFRGNFINGNQSSTNPFTYAPEVGTAGYSFADGVPLKIVGILEPKDNLNYGMLSTGFYYTTALAEYAIEQNIDSELSQFLIDNDKTSFSSTASFFEKGSDLPAFMGGGKVPFDFWYYTGVTYEYSYTYETNAPKTATGLIGSQSFMSSMVGMMGSLMGLDMGNTIETTYSMQQLGGNALPSRFAIYPLDFEQKEFVLEYLKDWNSDKTLTVKINGVDVELTPEERGELHITDTLSLIIGMIKSLVQLVTIALIGFTSLALVVSCVMIGIITYVSVVERIKEIGVIRSLGGRKRDVSNLFIAETAILGLGSGLIGVGFTYFASWIINLIVSGISDIAAIAIFPLSYALAMIGVSVGLMLISGLLPSRSAAKKDPVVALRTE